MCPYSPFPLRLIFAAAERTAKTAEKALGRRAYNHKGESDTMIFRAAMALMVLVTVTKASDEEVTLFNGKGKATAYIAVDDAMTIYLWGGKPVAYLEPDKRGGGFHIYGFSGKHLGWFVQGVVRDHDGDAACAVKDRMKSTDFEPFKAFKEFKPFKSFKEFAPLRPTFSKSFGSVTCSLFLGEGGE